jgi:alpha-amylase
MEKTLCFYFQVHQPYRIKPYSVWKVGTDHDYFDEVKNKEIFEKVARKCYLPTNALLLELLETYPEFRCSFSLSGVFLSQCLEYGEVGQAVLDSFKKLVKTGRVEILSETYYHSLSYLYSKQEFAEQVYLHDALIAHIFKVRPKVFRNTELIYNNELANFVARMGFSGIIAEGADRILEEKTPNHVYRIQQASLPASDTAIAEKYGYHAPKKDCKLLVKNYKLSDDIAFRFSNKGWVDHPLSVEKFLGWVQDSPGETINLFMDYETFGEHQWEDTGIFEFLRHLPEYAARYGVGFKTPSETIAAYTDHGALDMHTYVSWADMERDLSAWLGNKIQETALKEIYKIEHKIRTLFPEKKQTKQYKTLMDTWRKLQTSDQFYYMCTKFWEDGDVHKYFSPYDSPYDAFINFMNALTDFEEHILDPLLTPTTHA